MQRPTSLRTSSSRKSSSAPELLGRVFRLAARERVGAPLDEALEALEVELASVERQAVTGAVGLDAAGPQGLSQPMDVYLERLHGRPRGLVSPQQVDETLPGEDFVGIEEQDREQGALLGRSERNRSLVDGLDRPE